MTLLGDSVSLVVGTTGAALRGWTDVRVTRGIERMPSDFGIGMTERFTDNSLVAVSAGDPFQLLIGSDVVMTGYVDTVTGQLAEESHSINVAGRSRCADLVDCAAEWAGMQIMNSDLLQIATRLVAPYEGLQVLCDIDDLPVLMAQNIMLGETPWAVIERNARFSAALVYDNPDGNLVLTRVGSDEAAGGLFEGMNVESASVAFSMLDRFSEYVAVQMALDMFGDMSGGSMNVIARLTDSMVPRRRQRVIVAENVSAIGIDVAAQRAAWEMNRRTARGSVVTITTDSWRDSAGTLWTPNTLVHVKLPTLKLAETMLLIGEVTYRLDDNGGTHADLSLMPPEAFAPEPFQYIPPLGDATTVDVGGVR
jgi:prophage tail gpP-like protein